MSGELGQEIAAVSDGREAAARADVICTVTSSAEPVLFAEWVKPGTHINLVGSSYLGPVEVDPALVVASRFFADSREGCLRQGAEFVKASEAGLIGGDHLVAEIGEVLAGMVPGRRSQEELTVYKSLGHIVQDLATGWALHTGLGSG